MMRSHTNITLHTRAFGTSDYERVNTFQILKALWSLGKPRVVSVMLVCAAVGLLLAQSTLPTFELIFFSMSGIAMASMGAAAFNHCLDQQYDRFMNRTSRRPVATGLISTPLALLYASMMSLSGLLLLWFFINPLTSVLTGCALVGYAAIYTAFLKHATPQNITIGGLAGAAPPLLGWTSVTNQIDSGAILLVLIIFAWTPAHFWALAIHKRDEYANAGIPMLPVTHGLNFTRLQIWLYTWLTLIATLLPFITGMAGLLYFLLLVPLNVRWLVMNWKVYKPVFENQDENENSPQWKKNNVVVSQQTTGENVQVDHARMVNTGVNTGINTGINTEIDKAPMQAFWFSIRYLMYVFLLLLVDHYIALPF